jgi:aminopeptidase
MFDGLIRSSEITLMDCCSLKRNEKLLIICDPPNMEIGTAFYEAAQNRCQETVLVMLTPESRQGRLEFPESVMDLLRRFDVAVIPLSTRLSHVQTKQVASESRVRIASFTEITAEIFSRTMNADWRKIGINTRKVAGRLSTSKSVRVVNRQGTDFTFQTDDSPVFTDDGRIPSEGGFNTLPAGQVCLTPREGTFEGVVAIDGYFSLEKRKPQQALIIEVKQGLITSIRNHPLAPELEKYFIKYKEAARTVCGIGLGLLDNAKVSGNFSEDKVASGAIRLIFGKDLSNVTSEMFPMEGVASCCTISVDGKLLLQDGTFVQ